MTREEVLQIERLSKEEKEKVENECNFLTWDLELLFMPLLKLYLPVRHTNNPTLLAQLDEARNHLMEVTESLSIGKESATFKVFLAKKVKLEPFLSDKYLELQPSTEILESWAKPVSHTLCSQSTYDMLATTLAKMGLDSASYQLEHLALVCRKISHTMIRNRSLIRKLAWTLGEHDRKGGGDKVVEELDALSEKQKSILEKKPRITLELTTNRKQPI
ncbi:MAG: hypothetical protein LUC43_07495 [Burkholderiales bacterium]|nr:hypothetical protein [Burkholderiales bacterium]